MMLIQKFYGFNPHLIFNIMNHKIKYYLIY